MTGAAGSGHDGPPVRHLTTDVVIAGAGPAGLSAAMSASDVDASVIVVDQFAMPGGQYFMQPAPDVTAISDPRRHRQAEALMSAVSRESVQWLSGAEVVAAYPNRLLADTADGSVVIDFRALVIATGAHDRSFPFPGWTLPGVMTPGAAQRILKTQGVKPGRRVLLAGSGPFLFAVADTLISGNVDIAALVEAQPRIGPTAMHLLAYPERWGEALRLWLQVRRTGIPIRRGTLVTAVHGKERVEAATISAIRPDGDIDTAQSQRIEDIDAVLVGYGFRPQIDIAAVLGCDLAFDETLGGWHVAAAQGTGQTSVPGVFVAGEVSGVAGYRPGMEMGKAAGFAAARYVRDRSTSVRPVHPGRARAFGIGLQRRYPVPSAVDAVMSDDVILCRCESVSVGEVRAAIVDGVRESHGAKLWTRAGMGWCQGRVCGSALSRLIARETGCALADAGFNRPRNPLRPINLATARAGFDALADNPTANADSLEAEI